MATLQFSRNTKVYLEQGSNIWEIPVLDGFSFSQATNATEITLNEMENTSGVSRRDRTMFTDSYAPAEWSFDTYIRPNSGSAVEEALWANFVAVNSFNGTAWTNAVTKGQDTSTTPATTDAAAMSIDFNDSNSTTLGLFNVYFVLGACGDDDANYTSAEGNYTIYKIEDCVVNSASVDFEIDGIAMISWSGFGKIISEVGSFDASGAITTGVSSTDNFIRNRLTTLSVTAADTTTFPGASSNGVYNVTLTGGNITFENNISYLTPETLCVVNQPIGHITGTRSITGNFTCYLDGTTGGSEDLFEDIIGATQVVTNSFALTFSIGGASAPKLKIAMPTCHLEVPAHSIEDVISVDTAFHALPSATGQTDEAIIVYTG
jgi:hypothetical protein